MSEKKDVRLNKLVKEFNVSIDRILTFLDSKGIKDLKPNSKVTYDVYMDLLGEFDSEKKAKLSADLLAKEKELAKAEEIIRQQEEEVLDQKKHETFKQPEEVNKNIESPQINKDTKLNDSDEKKIK